MGSEEPCCHRPWTASRFASQRSDRRVLTRTHPTRVVCMFGGAHDQENPTTASSTTLRYTKIQSNGGQARNRGTFFFLGGGGACMDLTVAKYWPLDPLMWVFGTLELKVPKMMALRCLILGQRPIMGSLEVQVGGLHRLRRCPLLYHPHPKRRPT